MTLVHPCAAGVRTVRGAALFVIRCRVTLRADDEMTAADASNVMLLRDNLIDAWGEPARIDVLQALAFLGMEWAHIHKIELREPAENSIVAKEDLRESRARYRRRVETCRAMWREMQPTEAESRAVKASLTPYTGWPASSPVVTEIPALESAA